MIIEIIYIYLQERIQKDAMQINWMTDYSEKDTCFNKTSCNTELLLKKGELVHHYGLLHCLVDDILHEYAQNRFSFYCNIILFIIIVKFSHCLQ